MKEAAPGCSIELDVELARSVQQVLFPKGSPVCNWNCTGVKNRMAKGVGGDFFDFVTLGDGSQMILLGDVTGHGLQASLVMALLYGYVHHAALGACDPLRLAGEVNGFLDMFARRTRQFDHFFSTTFFCGVIDPNSLQMRYVNAGHVAPLVRSEGKIGSLAVTGPPLGYFPDIELTLARCQFKRHDRLLMVTDGIIEAMNSAAERFGRRRLEETLRQHAGDHLEFLDVLFANLEAFGAEDPPGDDCTAIVMDLHGGWQTDA